MNKFQRLILVIGAVALVYIIWTTPLISIGPKGMYMNPSKTDLLAEIIDIRTAIAKSIGIITATILIFFAFSSPKVRKDTETKENKHMKMQDD